MKSILTDQSLDSVPVMMFASELNLPCVNQWKVSFSGSNLCKAESKKTFQTNLV